MLLNRREAVLSFLFGPGMLGLRSLATGIPMAILANPRRVLAQSASCSVDAVNTCPTITSPQFLILNVSQKGDPINANVPGSYVDKAQLHPPYNASYDMTPGVSAWNGLTAAAPWVNFGNTPYASRTSFFHHATNNMQHPNMDQVLRLGGLVNPNINDQNEMLPSFFAQQLAPCLNCVQAQPIALGTYENHSDTTEAIYFDGSPLAMMTATVLKQVLGNPGGVLGQLDSMRETDLDRLNTIMKSAGSGAQAQFIDQYALSRAEVKNICQSLLSNLASITDNRQDAQMVAAQVLFQMRVCPVVTVHIGFGDDNHSDTNFAYESLQTVTGVQTLQTALGNLATANMLDQVTFATLNNFGRTMFNPYGRDHNALSSVGLMIGKGIQASVIGGMHGGSALPINSASGAGVNNGDIALQDTMAAYALTLGTAIGIPADILNSAITPGLTQTAKIVPSALAS